MPAKERRNYSRILSNGKRLNKRRTKGMKSRAEYLESHNLSQAKPWVAEGVSRRTWYRRRGTGLAAIHKNNTLDRLVSKGSGNPSPTPSKAWISEHGGSSIQTPEAPDPCPFFIPEHIPGAPNLIPYGRAVTNAAVPVTQWAPIMTLAEIRASMGYRH